MSNSQTINSKKFIGRLMILYSRWNESTDQWGGSKALAIATPPLLEYQEDEDIKSQILTMWLTGFVLSNTLVVFMQKVIYILCAKKLVPLFEVVKDSVKDAVGVELVIHGKAQKDDVTGLLDDIFTAIRANGEDNPVLGHLDRKVDIFAHIARKTDLVEIWNKKLKSAEFQLIDVANQFMELLVVKDDDELKNIRDAARVTSSAMEYAVVPMLKKIIKEKKVVTHSSLINYTRFAVCNQCYMVSKKVKVLPGNYYNWYLPVFQSGGEFDLDLSGSSNDEDLVYDPESVIICAIGSSNNYYCSNVARTFLIDPDPMQIRAYDVLLEAQAAAIKALMPRKKASDAYQAAVNVVKKKEPAFAPNLTKSAGTGMGMEFCESSLILNAENDRVLESGMVFNVSIGFQDLQTENLKTKFSILLADTVVIEVCNPKVLTSISRKGFGDVTYRMDEDTGTRRAGCDPIAYKVNALVKDITIKELHGEKFNQISLSDLWIRPALSGRARERGTLEAQENSFRYSTSSSDEHLDLMFENIKHALFQAVENERVTLLHFHLQNHIMVGKKKTRDVQFYVVQTIGGGKRSANEPDECENKISLDIHEFVNRVDDLWRQPHLKSLDLQFDQPLRESVFHASWRNSCVSIIPTSHCLVELIQMPFVVITLSEIEEVNLHLYGIRKKDIFNMTIVFKDFKRDVMQIDSISVTYLERIAKWLSTNNIKYRYSLQWRNWNRMLKDKHYDDTNSGVRGW